MSIEVLFYWFAIAELTTEAIEEVQAQLDTIAQLTALLEAQKEQLNTIHTNTVRLTSTRAGYLDKLANLGAVGDTGGIATAGTIMAKLNKLLIDWSSARAGYLDNINTNTSNINTRLTSTRAGYLDKLANFDAVNDTELLMQSMADLELAILEGGQKNV